MMNFNLQPTLADAVVRLEPLQVDDFEKLYVVASDPMIWEQHPNKDRYQKEVFANFFKGAVESKGAFLIYDVQTGALIGSTRYYELDETAKSIAIGYTFLARSHWGTTYNRSAKLLLAKHAFQYIDTLIFHIGSNNIRSQKAIAKLGVQKIGELEMKYYGEKSLMNFVYAAHKADWVL
jgi:RimJ/RimL family protein N-acetyltransferase